MLYIFVCYAVPETSVKDNIAVSVPGNRMALLFAESFTKTCDRLICVTIPPQKSKWNFKKTSFLNGQTLLDGVETQEIIYSNFPLFKSISIQNTLYKTLKKIFDDNPNEDITFITVNSNAIVTLPQKKLMKKYKFKSAIFFSDMPFDENPTKNILRKLYRIWDNRVRLSTLSNFDACITSVQYLLDVYFHGKIGVRIDPPLDVAAYDKEIALLNKDLRSNDGYIDLVYTGSLNGNYNIPILISVAENLPDNYHFWFYGRGDYVDYVKQAEENSKGKIKYGGYLSEKDIRKIQVRADVLIALLDTEKNISKYAVASKIYDYMAAGIPVISSDVLSIPDEIKAFATIVDDHSIEDITHKILTITSDPVQKNAAIEKAKKAREYIEKNCNWKIQSCRIQDCMRKLNEVKPNNE